MRTQGSLALKGATVTNQEVEKVLRLRRSHDAQKKRLELAEAELVELENSIMARIQDGADVDSIHSVVLKSVCRTNVSWKSVCAELSSAEYVEKVLNQTKPTITCRLLIKEAA
ncbi:MAG: hypothetical protein BroJett040_10190 [Oligoflexia bacterium]|nr:MAG: hypothetical protein BroJett040_10190 [Oligoflexia bacterium]